ncbi:type III polyketide synthase [Nakamurella antarctica]|uniref:Type III polyketide synthase n=1 Tax=Nakamurella antarctica TaxID=1902245 RepID=A0A3G8ZJP2_9ACTN|nr:3-oxoacyl-[acyl-carrier-protein] synthase III C-terminal domain-containing protein [Nakamurella antarctica]AZI57569.1 type III polyketide synthase [Nakamurella antarctica]
MTSLAAVFPVLPQHRYSQQELTQAFAEVCMRPGDNVEVLKRLHTNTKVNSRNLALPLHRYRELDSFSEANDAYIAVAVDLGSQAVVGALARAGIGAHEVDLIIFTTITGVAAPSIDALVASQVGLRPDVKRLPLFGLGCVAGAAGIARLHDFLLGHPTGVAVLLSVELCSLTIQRDDRSMANLVASGLFGDGAAAVVAVGADRAAQTGVTGPCVIDSRSHLYPGSARTMGWDVGTSGLKIVLDAQVPELVHRYLGQDVRLFLKEHDLEVDGIGCWVSHPGGPKVIEAIETELDLPPAALQLTWESLSRVGNLSSASVLHVLDDTWRLRRPKAGTSSVLMAMGPGFCSELVLLQW